MKKKTLTALLSLCMSCTLLSGCEKTPDETIVREKGADSLKKYESGENTGNSLAESLGAPERYKNESVYEDGRLIVDTDADVFVPEADAVNTYQVSAKEMNQELIDKVTKAFFEGDKIYQGYSYHVWSKEDLQKQITLLKKYKSEGNLDPYIHGTDENGNLQYDIDEQIARYEEELKTAPETREKEEVTPALNLEYWNGKGEERVKETDTDHFSGVVETENGIYDYEIDYVMKPDMEFIITKNKDDLLPDPMEFSYWTEGEFVLADKDSVNYIPEESIKKLLNISYEDAEKTAKESIEKLGLDLSVTHWDYAVFCHGEEGARETGMLDAGYEFQFARCLDGVPVTYELSFGGGLEDMDSTLTPWGYERCSMIVGDDGIQKITLINPYDIGEIQTENVKLMDFDSIIGIYEQMMEVSNADIVNYEAKRTYHIRNIKFGYTRIYDPAADNDTGLLVPVWDFFGGFDAEMSEGDEGFTHKNSGEYSSQSFMTINAIDGSVINRELGY